MEQRLEQLVKVLSDLRHLYEELSLVVKKKLAAMREADIDGIRSACAREEFLVQRIGERDGLRRQICDLVGQELTLGDRQGRSLTLREMSSLVAEPWRSRLLGLAGALRARLEETAETNRVAAMVSHEMVKHFRHLYEVMAQANQTVLFYSRTGQAESKGSRPVFDAVV